MMVENEIVSHFIGQSFLNPDDDRVLDQILSQKIAGTPFKVGDLKSKEEWREMLRAHLRNLEQKPQSIPVSPQGRRQTARTRLRERSNSVVARILKDLGWSFAGREVGRAIPEMRRFNNRTAVTRLLNKAINDSLGIGKGQRNTINADDTESGLERLDNLGDEVRERIRQASGDTNG